MESQKPKAKPGVDLRRSWPIRLSEGELRSLRTAAQVARLPLGVFVRSAALRAAEVVLAEQDVRVAGQLAHLTPIPKET